MKMVRSFVFTFPLQTTILADALMSLFVVLPSSDPGQGCVMITSEFPRFFKDETLFISGMME